MQLSVIKRNLLVHLPWPNNVVSPQVVAVHDKHHKLHGKHTKQHTHTHR